MVICFNNKNGWHQASHHFESTGRGGGGYFVGTMQKPDPLTLRSRHVPIICVRPYAGLSKN